MIQYDFILDTGQVSSFQIDPQRSPKAASTLASAATWTQLTYHQCANCPLQISATSHCPAAVDLEEVIHQFGPIYSTQVADVVVRTPEREYAKACDVQTGLQSLIGLVMATSGCPILGQSRGLAQHHLPYPSIQETVFRGVSAYLLKQYFIHRDGGRPDWDLVGLKVLYDDLRLVNIAFSERVRGASHEDANLNAIVGLFSVSSLLANSLDTYLAQLRPLFGPLPAP